MRGLRAVLNLQQEDVQGLIYRSTDYIYSFCMKIALYISCIIKHHGASIIIK